MGPTSSSSASGKRVEDPREQVPALLRAIVADEQEARTAARARDARLTGRARRRSAPRGPDAAGRGPRSRSRPRATAAPETIASPTARSKSRFASGPLAVVGERAARRQHPAPAGAAERAGCRHGEAVAMPVQVDDVEGRELTRAQGREAARPGDEEPLQAGRPGNAAPGRRPASRPAAGRSSRSAVATVTSCPRRARARHRAAEARAIPP